MTADVPALHDSTTSLALTPALAESERLHARVRRFAEFALEPPLVQHEGADDFERLALDIAKYQVSYCPGFARLVQLCGCSLDSLDEIPAVTVDTFRLTRVQAHPPELDQLVFRTSGTTQAQTGRHALRTTLTYRALAVGLARRTLFSREPRGGVVIALAENPGPQTSSSLGLMMRIFMETMDGEALRKDPRGLPFDVEDPGRWLVKSGLVDLEGLRRACAVARTRGRPLFILATGFALAATLEALDGEELQTPQKTTLMLTGGLKGRRTSIRSEDLRQKAASIFGIKPGDILGEYGMTELTSQLYEGFPETSEQPPAGPLASGFRQPAGTPDLYFPPPWLRVTAVDPASGKRVPRGTPGLARFCDLGNVDSALFVVTEDLIVEEEPGIRLLGRRVGAPVRGCSLPFEGLVAQEAQ